MPDDLSKVEKYLAGNYMQGAPPVFRYYYEGYKNAKFVEGIVIAENEKAAYVDLKNQGVFVSSLEEEKTPVKPIKPASNEAKNILKETKTNVYLELFAHPAVSFNFFVGSSIALFSIAFGNWAYFGAGITQVMFGVGVFLTKIVFDLDRITKAAQKKELLKIEELKNAENERENQLLDQLDFELTHDRDSRPENCLRELRSLYILLEEKTKQNPLQNEILHNFKSLFDDCVKQIKETNELWKMSKKLTGQSKKEISNKREKLVAKIEETSQNLSKIVSSYEDLGYNSDAKVKELELTLNAAQNVSKRLKDLDNLTSGYKKEDFE